jgi:hypothetical protein
MQTPEDRELERKRAEVAAIEGELADRELESATLQNELRAFEARYLRVVGRLYAELDELRAQVAEARSHRNPQNRDLQQQASDARARATGSAEAVGAVSDEAALAPFTPRDDVKKLYREIAKLLHPDLTTNDHECTRRTRLMADANRAYAAGDEARLRAILDEWISSPESVHGDGIGAELVRTIRKIHQAERRIVDIETEMAALRASEVFTLFQQVAEATAHGRDLLAQMARRLNEQIASTREELITPSYGVGIK